MARIKPQALLQQSKRKKGPTQTRLATIITCKFVVILIVLSLYATYRHRHGRSSDQSGFDLHDLQKSETFGESKKYNLPSYAILNTGKGSITMELDKDASPDVVDKFVVLCQKGYFKMMPFHHVIKNYVIQGGHSQRIGAAEDWILKGKSNNQLAISPKHEAFMIGTTVANSDDKGFELFITTAPIPDLNEKLVVFGRVIKGEDVVQKGSLLEESSDNYQTAARTLLLTVVLT
ncbi:peptidyl-prolyl cis-trans isomerase CYP21-4 isoform X2 [Elaeis guineensis]|uniref:peptidyl-prolyl cis-trans isomerase CYP21-4 isoform X2 n=1 Tax=Elaeis guineensis var. tenera TaxID=51953 RepID=UPI003C6D5365